MRTWGTELGPGEGCGGPSRLESWSSCCWSLQVTEQVALNQGVEWGGVRGVDSSKPWFVSCAKWVPGLAERWREVTPYAVMAPPVPLPSSTRFQVPPQLPKSKAVLGIRKVC